MKTDNQKPFQPIEVRPHHGQYLASEIVKVITTEKITVRAVVERLLSRGPLGSLAKADGGPVRTDQDATTAHAELSQLLTKPRAKFLFGELWEGWAMFTMNAGFLPDSYGAQMAKVKTMFAYEKLLQTLDATPDRYPLGQAIADAFSLLWSSNMQPTSAEADQSLTN